MEKEGGLEHSHLQQWRQHGNKLIPAQQIIFGRGARAVGRPPILILFYSVCLPYFSYFEN
jgi:hypothetical protein